MQQIPDTATTEQSVAETEKVSKPEHIETVTHITGPKIIDTIDPEVLKPKKKTSSKEQ
jgi:hypothetical protein